MEEKINIAAILKDKSQGTKLYDWLHNIDIELDTISTTDTETVVWCTNETNNNTTCHRGYSEFGTERGYPDGLQILFPSKEMRDWRKFLWKKGDILVSNDNDRHIIFEGFSKDDYTTFEGKYWINVSKKRYVSYLYMQKTQNYHIEYDKDATQTYINTIEEIFGGKLNRETLEIEKQPEFKDGDVVFVRLKRFCFIEIFNYFKGDYLYDHASLSTKTHTIDICCKYPIYKDEIVEIRIANDSEKKQLFEALSKENKVWNAEKKQVVDLKIKWITPKPFDRVITRNAYDDIWTANIFSHMNSCGEYVTIGCAGGYHYCLPYNDETAHLLGTTDEWKVGKG